MNTRDRWPASIQFASDATEFDVMLVADRFAGTGGEVLAAAALAAWHLPLHPGTRRMRALVIGAVAATTRLQRLRARLRLRPGAVVFEVEFLDAEPRAYDPALMPEGAEWGWHRDRSGTCILSDHLDLLAPVTHADHPECEDAPTTHEPAPPVRVATFGGCQRPLGTIDFAKASVTP